MVFDGHPPCQDSTGRRKLLVRLSQVSGQLDSMIAEERDRASRGIVAPRFILTATIDQIERIAAPEPGSNILVQA